MCRLLGWVSPASRSMADVLGPADLAAFSALSAVHGDGWGVATAASGGAAPAVVRSPTRAEADPRFAAAARTAAAAGVAHLRWATPGLAVGLANTHPFTGRGRLGDLVFVHNGALHPQEQLERALPLEPPYLPGGTTDSERYFLTLARALDSGADLLSAIGEVVDRVAALRVTSLNALLLTPTDLVVVTLHDPAQAPAATQVPTAIPRPRRTAQDAEPVAPYFELRYRRTEEAVVVASSGFAQPSGQGWTALPNGSVTVIDRATGDVQVLALGAGLVPSRP